MGDFIVDEEEDSIEDVDDEQRGNDLASDLSPEPLLLPSCLTTCSVKELKRLCGVFGVPSAVRGTERRDLIAFLREAYINHVFDHPAHPHRPGLVQAFAKSGLHALPGEVVCGRSSCTAVARTA